MQIHTSTESFLLDLFASLSLISATMVIVSKNPIHSVVFLILVFCNATGLLILLRTEFLAMMFLIIYVGAIAVLFLFVVMMLNIKVNELSSSWLRCSALPIGGLISVIFLLEIFLILDSDFAPIANLAAATTQIPFWNLNCEAEGSQTLANVVGAWSVCAEQKPWTTLIATSPTNIQSLGFLIYTYYFFYFLMASLILLVAMIGAVVLTSHKRKSEHASKKQLIFKQVARNFEDAIRM